MPKNFETISFPLARSLIFLDIDGTLLPDGADELSEKVKRHVEEMKKMHEVRLITNGRNRARAERFAEELGTPLIRGPRKPFGILPDVEGLPKVVVGDKLLTDGLAALRSGAQFIRVDRKISGKESLKVRLICLLDDAVSLWYSIFHL